MSVYIYAPGESGACAWDGGHLLTVTQMNGPNGLGPSETGLFETIQEVCRERGIPVRFVGGQFGGAGIEIIGPIVRLAGGVLRWGLRLLTRYRKKESFRESRRLGWGSVVTYDLTLGHDCHEDAIPYFVAHVLAMFAEVERRQSERWGSDFAIDTSLTVTTRAASGERSQPVLGLTVDPDSLRGSGFPLLYKLARKAVKRWSKEKGFRGSAISRSVVFDRAALTSPKKTQKGRNRYLDYVTSPGPIREEVPIDLRPKRDI